MTRPVLTEFPRFDMAYCPPIPAGWQDMSWHNDACPFWLADPTTGVFVDYLTKDLGDWPDLEGWTRYTVVEMLNDPEHGSSHTDAPVLLGTDDWDEVLRLCRERAVRGAPALPRAVRGAPALPRAGGAAVSWVVAYGSPAHGFKLHGPFPTAEEAGKWGEGMGEGGEWVMEVHAPDPSGPPLLYPWDEPEPLPAALLRWNFQERHTGGGCRAWVFERDDRSCVVVTATDGGSEPAYDDWLIGCYPDEEWQPEGAVMRDVAAGVPFWDALKDAAPDLDW